ncbi:hypothetical protein [Mycoplana sp. MJR14]|uniref:hypothetical protein n=1 Tax=Mycoplana sp. MJR14 TaxID=3032583 RepID=UPI0023DB2A8D|nr:hypothetical protein [Mycoplana sp. MJR14]MDF1631238.1 hypothetical protein [Mycoplana sp. MJR14]
MQSSFNVLVVEDEFFLALEMEHALVQAGYRVLGPVSTIGNALDLLGRELPDAAVLDVRLGSERVTPVAIQLKALGIPFFLASASSDAELAADNILAEVVNFGKPTDLKRLIGAIDALRSG